MKEAHGWHWPDGEKHMLEWLAKNGKVVNGRNSYQHTKIAFLWTIQRSFDTAIDIGSHIGLWSYYLCPRFKHVYAFEPIDEHRACYSANMMHASNWYLKAAALGDEEGQVAFKIDPSSTGGTHVKGRGDIPMERLDSHKIKNVDLIKVDCEGYEYFALHGGEQTIRDWMPTIVVEQKPGMAQKFALKERQAVDWLEGLGYKCVKEMAGDFFMVPA